MPALPLILASSSSARRSLLARLQLAFHCHSPDIDESPQPGEDAATLAGRLSQAKAQALRAHYPAHLIIGSDQTLSLDGDILGKPGSHEAARRQLQRLSGRSVCFYTGLCLLNSQSGRMQHCVEPYRVSLRHLSDAAIERYLHADQPYACAGSFKAESLGISLFQGFEGRDPNSLIGLPLMALVDMLLAEGLSLP